MASESLPGVYFWGNMYHLLVLGALGWSAGAFFIWP
jgi:hypothetical protein